MTWAWLVSLSHHLLSGQGVSNVTSSGWPTYFGSPILLCQGHCSFFFFSLKFSSHSACPVFAEILMHYSNSCFGTKAIIMACIIIFITLLAPTKEGQVHSNSSNFIVFIIFYLLFDIIIDLCFICNSVLCLTVDTIVCYNLTRSLLIILIKFVCWQLNQTTLHFFLSSACFPKSQQFILCTYNIYQLLIFIVPCPKFSGFFGVQVCAHMI